MLALDIQRRLTSLGYDLGASGPAKDGVDGVLGEVSQQALIAALETGKAAPAKAEHAKPSRDEGPTRPPVAGAGLLMPWTPGARMTRIIVHWTAGRHRASALDKRHYHVLIEADGALVKGGPSIALNDASGCRPGYAAHTLNCNTGAIGVALCAMAGAVEDPFAAGAFPVTEAQWGRLPHVLAELCARYGIAVGRKSVLSHAEVQGALGVRQRGKWDVSRLAFDPSVVGARAVGDLMRARAAEALSQLRAG